MLTHGGAEGLLDELATAEEIEVAGVFVETVTERQRGIFEKVRRSIKYDGLLETAAKPLRLFGVTGPRRRDGRHRFEDASSERERLKAVATRLNIPYIETENYHLRSSVDKMKEIGADLGIIWGTNIVREEIFSIPRLGSINLHQGHAPYYRGGPTVFWELMNGESQLGITIHFVAAKVDTGDIVKQEFVELNYDLERYGADFEDFLDDFRATLPEPSVRLMAAAVREIAAGQHERKPQDITLGKRYRLPTKKEKDRLRAVLSSRCKKNG